MTDFGTIKSYDSDKGTGTIIPEQGGDALPFRKVDMQHEAQEPRQEHRYGYDVQTGDGGRRRAVNLRLQQQESVQQEQQAEQTHREQARNQAG